MAWLTGFIKWYVEATRSFNFSWRWTNDSLWLRSSGKIGNWLQVLQLNMNPYELVVSAVHLMILVF